jgi:polyvinyl alcohol dehydrogenase (cytochrome)
MNRPDKRTINLIVYLWVISVALITLGCGQKTPAISSLHRTPSVPPISGEELYKKRCAACHDGPVARAPHKIVFPLLGPEHVLASMNEGIMQAQAAGLTKPEKTALAEYLGERPIQQSTESTLFFCDESSEKIHQGQSNSEIKSWGMSLENKRSVSADVAGLSKSDIGKLDLKWAFAYPNAKQARSQPIVSKGEIFLGSHDGTVYSLDLKTGCANWTFSADSEVRHALSLGPWKQDESEALFFGDNAGNVYAIDRLAGELIWKTNPNDHPDTVITGSPKLYGDKLYVPLSSREWASAANPAYSCCTFRGGVAALNTSDGTTQWISYSTDEPAPTGQFNTENVPLMAPSGAPVWNSPTIDVKRNRLYVGTGENYSSPASDTSDAVLAIDLENGELLWHYQTIEKDAWNMACFVGGPIGNCPSENGPDLDIGASLILATKEDGRDILLAGTKGGMVFGLDPDRNGELLWENKIGSGGFNGGVHWGMTLLDQSLIAAVADTDFGFDPDYEGHPGLYSININNGKLDWQTPAEDHCAEESRPMCSDGMSAAITSIPGAIFAGSFDGSFMAYDDTTGEILWKFLTNRSFETISGETANGGSIEGDGPVIIDGTVLINSGYSFGTRMQGNVLLAFTADGN